MAYIELVDYEPRRARSLRLGLPEGWVDRSVLTYVGPDSGAGSPSLVVSSDELGDGMTLGRYAAMQDAAVRAGSRASSWSRTARRRWPAEAPSAAPTAGRYDERTMRQRMWCLVVDGVGYAIVASAADGEFDGLRGDLRSRAARVPGGRRRLMRLRATVAYDGTDFHGWAPQPGLRTVAGVLGEAFGGPS